MKNKLFLLTIFLVMVGFTTTNYLIPKFRPFGTSTTFTDSTNYVTLNKGLYIQDSLKVTRDLYVGTTGGKMYLDTNRNGQIYFTGLSMYVSNTKNKGYMYFTTNQAFNFEQDISGSLVDIASLDTNGLSMALGYVRFGNMTSTRRDAITPAAGMVIFNTTTNKLQVYAGGTWVDLH